MKGLLRVAVALAGVLAAMPGVARAQNMQDIGRGLLNQLAPQQPQGRGEADAYERGRRDAEEQRRRDDDRRRAERDDFRRNDDRRRPDLDRRPNESQGGNYDYGRGGSGYNGQQNGYPGQQRY